MTTLLEFIEQRLTEDEWWARNAGGCPGFAPPATGEHWQWERSDNDEIAYAGPAMGEHLEDGDLVALRSVEKYGTLPSFIVYESECVNTVGAGHIVRHDPARVLREVQAKRRVLARHRLVDQTNGWAHRTPRPGEDVSLRHPAAYCSTCRTGACGDDYDATCGWVDWPCPEVLDLAAPFAGHPDYDPSWSPS